MESRTIDPIQRSLTVSKKVKGVFLTLEDDKLEAYKNDRKVLSIKVRDFDKFLRKIRIK